MYGLEIVCIDCGGPVEEGKNRCAAHLRRTPDRAVVDDEYVPWTTNGTIRTQDGEQIWPMPDRAMVETMVECDWCKEYDRPRALVALSDDRQWLVVLGTPYRQLWGVYQFDRMGAGADFITEIEDTGQDAQDVLASFLAQRREQ